MAPQFAATPNDAIQCFADARAETIAKAGPRIIPYIPTPPVYFISGPMGLVLAEISRQFPLQAKPPDHLGDGFLVFARPTLFLKRAVSAVVR
jgi:hypothetical protein